MSTSSQRDESKVFGDSRLWIFWTILLTAKYLMFR